MITAAQRISFIAILLFWMQSAAQEITFMPNKGQFESRVSRPAEETIWSYFVLSQIFES